MGRTVPGGDRSYGPSVDTFILYEPLYKKRSKGTLTAVGCLHTTIEPIAGLDEGRLLFSRMPDSRSTLANFMRTLLFSVLGTLRIGIDKLYEKERVKIDKILGYGSFLKVRIAGQKLIAAALNTPVAVMETTGEGGSWGMALLAEYMCHKEQGNTLENYLENRVFKGEQGAIAVPDPKQVQSFACFTERYKKGLAIEHAAVETIVLVCCIAISLLFLKNIIRLNTIILV